MNSRVKYVASNRNKLQRNKLSRRALQVLKLVEKRHGASAAELQQALKVNRNVIAGAMAKLRVEKMIKSEYVQ